MAKLNSDIPTTTFLNRAMRRKLKRKGYRPELKIPSSPQSLAEFIKAHPEAVKFELDEEKIKELEAQEALQISSQPSQSEESSQSQPQPRSQALSQPQTSSVEEVTPDA